MKKIQINHNVIDETILKEVKQYMLPTWQRNALIFAGVFSLAVGILNYVAGYMTQGIILMVLTLACVAEMMFLNHQKYKTTLKAMKKEDGKVEMVYTMIFGENGIAVHNVDTGEDNKISYNDIKHFKTTQNTYLLLAKKNEMIIVRKDCLKMEGETFKQFLRDKNIKVK